METSKKYEINGPNGIVSVIVEFEEYPTTSAISVSLYSADSCELYSVITVNLPESAFLPYGTQYVDINNNPQIEKWLIRNNLARPTGMVGHSGFCSYPAYAFNLPIEMRIYQLNDDGSVERREPDGVVVEDMIERDEGGRFENLLVGGEIIFASSESCNFYNEGRTFGAYQEPQAGDLYFKNFGGYCFYRQGLEVPTGRDSPMGAWCLIGTKDELRNYVKSYYKNLEIDDVGEVLLNLQNA